MKDINRLRLSSISACHLDGDLIRDLDAIAGRMKAKNVLTSCSVVAKSHLTIALKVTFKGIQYLVVFCHFPKYFWQPEAMDITISEQSDNVQ